MKNRAIAIFHSNKNMDDNVKTIVNILHGISGQKTIVVFTSEPNQTYNTSNGEQTCMNVVWPSTCNTVPKMRNWINQFFKTSNFKGILHVIDDTTKICKDPTLFIAELEHMMDVLDYNVWFSTYTDPCNFVYKKYNPRLEIQLDDQKYKKLELCDRLMYTSHSNTAWIAYDFEKVQDQLLSFDEDFTVPMFWIIEFLARRKATKKQGQLFYMNQYLTVPSEYGVIQSLPIENSFSPQTMQEEDAKFKTKNVQYAPDNNIDIVLEDLYRMLKAKIS